MSVDVKPGARPGAGGLTFLRSKWHGAPVWVWTLGGTAGAFLLIRWYRGRATGAAAPTMANTTTPQSYAPPIDTTGAGSGGSAGGGGLPPITTPVNTPGAPGTVDPNAPGQPGAPGLPVQNTPSGPTPSTPGLEPLSFIPGFSQELAMANAVGTNFYVPAGAGINYNAGQSNLLYTTPTMQTPTPISAPGQGYTSLAAFEANQTAPSPLGAPQVSDTPTPYSTIIGGRTVYLTHP